MATLIINYGKPIDRMKLRKHTFAIGEKELFIYIYIYIYLLYVDIWVWDNSFRMKIKETMVEDVSNDRTNNDSQEVKFIDALY